ncbi:hypothetical protein VNI00_010245 [Paramarasmius palmivorus]|uniref:Uncharacterized protein n=1 Tax=Paramarasmius palmivorus TaxID=297713 RepID=A0AAW0CJN6_9AGAR
MVKWANITILPIPNPVIVNQTFHVFWVMSDQIDNPPPEFVLMARVGSEDVIENSVTVKISPYQTTGVVDTSFSQNGVYILAAAMDRQDGERTTFLTEAITAVGSIDGATTVSQMLPPAVTTTTTSTLTITKNSATTPDAPSSQRSSTYTVIETNLGTSGESITIHSKVEGPSATDGVDKFIADTPDFHSKYKAAIIIGGMFGGVVFLTSVHIVFICRRRAKQKSNENRPTYVQIH